jgi:hypothetical protein
VTSRLESCLVGLILIHFADILSRQFGVAL